MGKEQDIEFHETKRIPNYLNAKRPSSRCIISKFNDKGRILKSAREEKMVTYKETPVRLSAVFSIVKERVE